MAKFSGTRTHDVIQGALDDDNVFSGFGVGFDAVTGGNRIDTFRITQFDTNRDVFDGGAGRDHLDLSAATLPAAAVIRLGETKAGGSISLPAQSLVTPQPTVLAELRNIEDVTGTAGDDRIFGSRADNMLKGGAGKDSLFGGEGNDTLFGGDGDDRLSGDGGRNALYGEAGNDTFVFQFDRPDRGAVDTLDGGADIDTLSFASPGSQFLGVVVSLSTEFAPSMIGIPTPPPSIDQGFVKSAFRTSVNSETHTREADITGIENVIGTSADDTLIGDRKDNVLQGGDGNDLLSGETGADTLDGGAGDDVFESYADGALDTIMGGAGIDTLEYLRSSQQVIVTLADEGAPGNASVFASVDMGVNFFREDVISGVENVTGSRYADRIEGNGADNTLIGAGGDDILLGKGGDDVLNGGGGQDDMTGGTGADVFQVWDSGIGVQGDKIFDFVSGTDKIDVSGFFSNARANHIATSAQDAPDFIGSRAFSGDGGAEIRIAQSNGESHVQIDFGSGSLDQFDVEIHVVGSVAAGDFIF